MIKNLCGGAILLRTTESLVTRFIVQISSAKIITKFQELKYSICTFKWLDAYI